MPYLVLTKTKYFSESFDLKFYQSHHYFFIKKIELCFPNFLRITLQQQRKNSLIVMNSLSAFTLETLLTLHKKKSAL